MILLIGGIVLAIGLSIGLVRDLTRPRPLTQAQAASGAAAIGGPFRLVDQNGRAVNETVLQGQWTAMFFGYTYCPDVCPATLTALKVAKDRLGDKAKDLQVVFVTIDPERDTPAQLKSYLSTAAFPQPTLGLTGTPEQIAAMAKAYKVYYAKNGTGADYLMDHASAVYLIDPKGQFHSLVSDAQGVDSMTFEIGQVLGAG
jgi:protein SCO1/2